MTPDDFDWRAEGQASSRALGWVLLLVAALTILGLIGAVVALVVGIARAGVDLAGGAFIALAVLAVAWQVRGVVRDERARQHERVQR